MMKAFKLIAFLTFIMCSLQSFASENSMLRDTYYKSGKINVVITVFVIALVGIFVFMFMTERRIKKLEEEVKKK